MRNKFDMQLGLLNEQLIHMGELCELAINRATKALQKGSIEEAKHVIDADQEIDQMEKTKISVREYSKKQEEYKNWALLVFGLLLGEILLRNTLLRNIP